MVCDLLIPARHGRLGAALHDYARTAEETDWPQILDWYDELLELKGNPVAALSRAVVVARLRARSPG
jgi:predicted RNA polymerase sigma factor